jgi:small-conductance mechanosensitive channel
VSLATHVGVLVPAQVHSFPEVLRDWHERLLLFVENDLIKLAVFLVLAFVAQRIVHFFVKRMNRLADRQLGQRGAQLRTMASIVRATAYGIIVIVVVLHVLSLFFNITPILASAGVVGVGIGLGAQSLFKDMINGIFILIEDQYNVGEVVKLAGLQGTVENLTLRTTTLRDGDGTLYIIPNSQIATVSNLSRDYSVASLSISVDASVDPDRVIPILTRVADEVRHSAQFREVVTSEATVLGVDRIEGHQVIYPLNIRVQANQRDGVLREMRRRLIQTFAEEHIPLGNASTMLMMPHPADPTVPPVQSATANATDGAAAIVASTAAGGAASPKS